MLASPTAIAPLPVPRSSQGPAANSGLLCRACIPCAFLSLPEVGDIQDSDGVTVTRVTGHVLDRTMTAPLHPVIHPQCCFAVLTRGPLRNLRRTCMRTPTTGTAKKVPTECCSVTRQYDVQGLWYQRQGTSGHLHTFSVDARQRRPYGELSSNKHSK